MNFTATVGQFNYRFKDLKDVLAKASPQKSGDSMAGIAAENEKERVAAKMVLADIPLQYFTEELIIPYEEDSVSRLIMDSLDQKAFHQIASLTVGEFRDWLLRYETDSEVLHSISAGLMPEMVAAVSKLMSNQDLILVASKCEVITQFRNTVGKKGHFSTRLQPNHPTDDAKGIMASTIDGLMYGIGDAVIGINPVTDHTKTVGQLVKMLDELITKYEIPTQSCVLAHVTTTMDLIKQNYPIDLVFQSIGGTEDTNRSFGISLDMLDEAFGAGLSLDRSRVGDNIMYFETGQGSAHSANAHYGVDQQTCEARAYAVARRYKPFLVNTVVGFIGPEYLYDGKQIIRAGLEDHFCGKLLGLPMGCDICYTNHAMADQDDMDTLLTVLGASGCNFIMGVPGADDIMLNYQSTSFHDQLYLRQLLGLKHSPEFEVWLQKIGLMNDRRQMINPSTLSHHKLLEL
jgi:ethanolamine ammonia-lyase large subunit